MERILDFGSPLDVALLDRVVAVLMDPRSPERLTADRILIAFKDHNDAWTRVDAILETSQSPQTKYIALQVLESVIKFRWKTLPAEQRDGIKTYLVQKIITLSQNERTLRTEGVLISKLNLLLVQVLKHEWPGNWPSFIPDVVGASKTSEVLCENNINILKLLSEEIFDFSKESMTSTKADSLKTSLTSEFRAIFELFDFILQASSKPSLINATLVTLQRYVTWIPEKYIFETRLLEMLCAKFLPVPAFRVNTLMVLTEVVGLVKPEYNRVFEQLYLGVMSQLVRMLPADVNVKKAYDAGSADDQLFIRHLALFLVGYFKSHAELLEPEGYRSLLHAGLNYLVGISDIDDPEVFKICLEYWLRLSNELYSLECTYTPAAVAAGALIMPQSSMDSTTVLNGAPNPRKAIYAEVLSRVREVMINHMAKPEEVLIEEDETGEIVRETTKDTDAIAMYKVMKDTLVYLTHLDTRDTENIMLDKLAKQVDGREWSWDALNTLCWAIGSISGTMTELDEKHFLVTVIKDLLGLCEAKRGKNNKAVVASNIMYVVGQYPRFLRAHWKFLRTVVLKLFEFMHERHPGVQDMAVDTFLKIAQKCRKKFVQVQQGESITFIEELCTTLPSIIADLETHQVHTFYEAAGCMVSAHPDAGSRAFLTERLMSLPNMIWARIMKSAADNIDALRFPETLRDMQRVLRTNVCACRSIGHSFGKQLGNLYLDMLNVYRAESTFIAAAVASGDPAQSVSSTGVKAMRAVKKEVLNLVSTYVSTSEDTKFVAAHFFPPLLDPVLGDYVSSAPATRDAEVLTLMTEIVSKLRGDILPSVPRILDALLDATLGMITANFQDYPEHRLAFFRLLEAINTNCFSALFALPAPRQKLIVDSVVWAFKHTARDIGETGLEILNAMLENCVTSPPEVAQPFYSAYYLSLVQDVMYVLTDRLHKAHFKQHATVLRHMFHLVESGAVTTPLWESAFAAQIGVKAAYEGKLNAAAATNGGVVPPQLLTNQQFVREYVRTLISSSFSNLNAAQTQAFVDGLFDMTRDLKSYKAHLRDFLIAVLEFKVEDAELFGEEKADAAATAAAAERDRRRAVPGLLNPYEAEGMEDL